MSFITQNSSLMGYRLMNAPGSLWSSTANYQIRFSYPAQYAGPKSEDIQASRKTGLWIGNYPILGGTLIETNHEGHQHRTMAICSVWMSFVQFIVCKGGGYTAAALGYLTLYPMGFVMSGLDFTVRSIYRAVIPLTPPPFIPEDPSSNEARGIMLETILENYLKLENRGNADVFQVIQTLCAETLPTFSLYQLVWGLTEKSDRWRISRDMVVRGCLYILASVMNDEALLALHRKDIRHTIDKLLKFSREPSFCETDRAVTRPIIIGMIEDLIPKLVRNNLEVEAEKLLDSSYAMYVIRCFIPWAQAMFDCGKREKLEKQLDLWVDQMRAQEPPQNIPAEEPHSDQPTGCMGAPTVESLQQQVNSIFKSWQFNTFLENIRCRQVAARWCQIRETARILGRPDLAAEASANFEHFKRYLECVE